MSGVMGPTDSGNCIGSCGQIDMGFAHRNPADDDKRYSSPIKPENIRFAPGWSRKQWFDLLDVWKRWHLNDMQAGCEHQRKDWDTSKQLELKDYTWSPLFHRFREDASAGKLSADQYEGWKTVSSEVLQVTIESRVKWASPLANKLLDAGWITEKKTETKAAGWVTESEHPEGLLSKPCPVCGYKYGTSWLKEDVPQDVIDWVRSLPDADKQPAWI